MECDRKAQSYVKLYQSVSAYFMEVNEKRWLKKFLLRMLVRKLILKMQVDLQWEQDQTQGFDNEEFAGFICT